jgi:thiosulfate dehydrogenase [quinone] large subunit
MLALTRIAVGVLFLFFAQYKLVSPGFARTGYAKYVGGYIQSSAVSFYKPFLRKTVEHAVASGYAVAVTELLIGISLVLGLRVRFFSLVGALFMLNLVLCTWNAPGPGPPWRYLANQLDNIPLLCLFLVFVAYRAGETWGLDARSKRSDRIRDAYKKS